MWLETMNPSRRVARPLAIRTTWPPCYSIISQPRRASLIDLLRRHSMLAVLPLLNITGMPRVSCERSGLASDIDGCIRASPGKFVFKVGRYGLAVLESMAYKPNHICICLAHSSSWGGCVLLHRHRRRLETTTCIVAVRRCSDSLFIIDDSSSSAKGIITCRARSF